MIHLHPVPDQFHMCPNCQVLMEVKGWYIPGMRNLANLVCPRCHLAYYGDLPAGQALYTPLLLEVGSGAVHDSFDVPWFANSLRDSFAHRSEDALGFDAEQMRPVERPILLNCLDTLYGHSLLKLLNAQYYLDHKQGLDLVVMVPRFLRWLVPDGVAAIWTVDLPLRRGTEWNDWLATELHKRIGDLDECQLSIALSHPHPDDYHIERFTRVRPFPVDEWNKLLDQPTVTFIWRGDRTWGDDSSHGGRYRPAQSILSRLGIADRRLARQQERVVALAHSLRDSFPRLDFAVAGFGDRGGLPDWITDLRVTEIDEGMERAWCERYARSHVVIGVHGSNMLLPSAHAGAVVELVPTDRRRNFLQDILITPDDTREALYRYRFLPLRTSPATVSEAIASLLDYLPNAQLTFNRPWCDHEVLAKDPWLVSRRRREIR